MAKPRLPPEIPGDREAIRAGHFDVHENEVGPELPGAVDGRNGLGFDGHEEIAGSLEETPKKFTDGVLIVDAKDSGF
jgi:hypothetical protein